MSYFRFRDYTQQQVKEFSSRFHSAKPFPHIVLDDVLTVSTDEVLEAFPQADWDGWSRFQDPYQRSKMYCNNIETIPEPLAAMINETNGPTTLEFLEAITGTPKLLPDPYLDGGGLHCSGSGGVLAPHTDFHLHRGLDLYRRYNLIVYLNPGWQENAGGSLELFEEKSTVPAVRITPNWGRCVIFQTDDRSVHGFTQPIQGQDTWRRSMAVYYYTSSEADKFSGDLNTYWRAHTDLKGTQRARLRLYQAFLFASRAFSSLAYRTNPNFVPPDVSERSHREA